MEEEGTSSGQSLDTLEKFAQDTTCHGLGSIVRARNKFFKIFWSLMVIIAMSVMLQKVVEMFQEYFAYNLKVQSSLTPPGLIEFPSVTICNLNPVRKSALDKADVGALKELKSKYLAMDVFANKLAKNLSSPNETIDNPSVNLDKRLVEYQMQVGLLLQRSGHLQELGHKKELLIHECIFRGQPCDASNFSLQVSPEYGNCYTFNSDELLKRPLGIAHAGLKGGLNLILNIERDEYFPFVSEGYGARVVIHEFGTYAFVAQKGVSVSSGLQTHLNLQMVNISRDVYAGYCVKGREFKELYNKTYSAEACELKELDTVIIDECKCQKSGFEIPLKRHANVAFCNKTKEGTACLKRILQEILDGTGIWKKWNKGCDKHCKKPCHQKMFTYKAISSAGNWPQESTEKLLTMEACQRVRKTDPSHVCASQRGSNFVSLVLFYDDTRYENMRLVRDYPLSSLQANVGGTLGLWAGISLLTVTEFFVLIMELFRVLHRRCRRADISNHGGTSGDAAGKQP